MARWASFPEEIPGDDLIRACTLTGADRDLVALRRGAANRLGLALQLCVLRWLRSAQFERRSAIGRLLCRGPARGQPGRDSILRSARAASRCSGHGNLEELEAWLVERALEHEAPKILFRRARERLRTERLVFPAPDRSPDPVCPFFHVQDRSHKRANAPEKEAEDVRCAAGLAEPREWLEPSGRSGAGAGCSTRPSGLHRSRPASGRVGGRERPPEVVYVCSVCTWKTRLNHRHLWINLTAAIA